MAKTTALLIRLTPAEKALIEERAQASGAESVSEYLRQLGMSGAVMTVKKATRPQGGAEPSGLAARRALAAAQRSAA